MQPLRHGYTNDSRSDGTTVVKRYVGFHAAHRRATELSTLTSLPAGLPVPRVLDAAPGELVLSFLPGRPGQELLDAGYAAEVLHACGRMLRHLQLLEPYALRGAPGQVLVHGDFGPNNMLFDPATFEVTALVDWEFAHAGAAVEDLAWCEWIVRMHHAPLIPALDHLFAGYGARPPWPERQAAAVARCRQITALVAGDGPDRVRFWEHRTEVTRTWQE